MVSCCPIIVCQQKLSGNMQLWVISTRTPTPSKKEGKRGEELITNKQIYPWSQNVNGLRDTRHGSWQGKFLANFKRGSGDNMGVAGGLNDRASILLDVKSFYPKRIWYL